MPRDRNKPEQPFLFPFLPWIIGGVALILDQASKVHAETSYLLSPPFPSIADHRSSTEILVFLGFAEGPHFHFDLTHVANAGITLGALEEAPSPIPLLAFLGTTGLGLAVAMGLFLKAKSKDWLLRIGAMLLATGVVGNLIDRIRLGYVVDWAQVGWRIGGWNYRAPAFNLADLFILAGVASCLFALLFRRFTPRQFAPSKTQSA